MTEQLHIIVVSHTHWDREWYQTFQQFRARLVQAVDKLLDILDHDEKFSYFMLDGQTIVLDDYLEVKPEQEQRLKHFIQAGRIQIGPWYIQPDEFLVSGEALIRNLQMGLQRARDFGKPLRVGYVPDCFGHIAQLPQILQGVGIDSAVFWRGVGAEAQQSEFHWAAPDGTSVLVIHLADPIGYSNARQLPLNLDEFITRVELLTANILPKATTNTLLFMNGSDHLEPQQGLPAIIELANARLAHLNTESQRHLENILRRATNGHTPSYESIQLRIGTLPEYIEQIRQHDNHLATLHGEMRSSQYAHLLPSVLSTRIWLKQQNAATEHLLERWVEPLSVWAAHYGASYPQGFIRLAWQYLLQNQPHDSICGCSIDQVHRENSVRFAQSQQIGESVVSQAMHHLAAEVDTRAPFKTTHPSDEPLPLVVFNPAPGPRTDYVQTTVQLPGSLREAVLIDEHGQQQPYRIVNRWRQVIGTWSFGREMLAAGTALAGITTPAQLIQMVQSTIIDSLGQRANTAADSHVISHLYVEEYTESPLHHTPHTPQAGVIYIEIMIAPQGRVVVNEQEILNGGQHILSLLQREDIHTFEVTLVDQARETIDFVATGLPAYGLKTFWLYPHGVPEREKLSPMRYQLFAQEQSIENDYYRVEVEPQDGTLIVTDKLSGAVFSGLNRFIDGGDVGDLYTYSPPAQDTLISKPIEPPKIELINNAPVCATLRISARWALPSSCVASRDERSARTAICPIVSEVSLTPGTQRINIHTRIENKVKDHRMRVIFPVSYTIERVVAEGTFEVRSRPIVQPHPADVAEWAEEPVNVFPQKRFVDLSNGQSGLAILNRGLPECEILQSGPVINEGESAIAITLLRCVEWLSRGDLATRHGHAGPMEHTPEAQCLGTHEFDYALVPHKGTWSDADAFVLREAQAFNTPITTRVVVTEQHTGPLHSTASFVEVEPYSLVVSSVKRCNSKRGWAIRIYNPCDQPIEAHIRPGGTFTRVYSANLLEEYQQSLTIAKDQKVHISVRPGGIITLVFE